MHKTATTWFQRQLYPKLDDVWLIRRKRPRKIAAAIDEARIKAPSSTVIVSAEGLGGSISLGRQPGAVTKKLRINLETLAGVTPDRAMIVGYREQQAWLRSAFAQRAKKSFGAHWKEFVGSFSVEELSWCYSLKLIQSSSSSVFPFLYEEFLYSPEILVEDLCGFLGKSVPRDLGDLLLSRSNPSPRSWLGQFASRTMRVARKKIKGPDRQLFENRIARFDSFFPPRHLSIAPDLASTLSQDWKELMILMSEIRGRDFCAFSSSHMSVKT